MKPSIAGNVKEDNQITWKLKQAPGCLAQLGNSLTIWFKYTLVFLFGYLVGILLN
jgi:hypothetical protein